MEQKATAFFKWSKDQCAKKRDAIRERFSIDHIPKPSTGTDLTHYWYQRDRQLSTVSAPDVPVLSDSDPEEEEYTTPHRSSPITTLPEVIDATTFDSRITTEYAKLAPDTMPQTLDAGNLSRQADQILQAPITRTEERVNPFDGPAIEEDLPAAFFDAKPSFLKAEIDLAQQQAKTNFDVYVNEGVSAMNEIMEIIKPATLNHVILSCRRPGHVSEKIAAVIAALEAYGIYWTKSDELMMLAVESIVACADEHYGSTLTPQAGDDDSLFARFAKKINLPNRYWKDLRPFAKIIIPLGWIGLTVAGVCTESTICKVARAAGMTCRANQAMRDEFSFIADCVGHLGNTLFGDDGEDGHDMRERLEALHRKTSEAETAMLEQTVLTPHDFEQYNVLKKDIAETNQIMSDMLAAKITIPNASLIMSKILQSQTKMRSHLLNLKKATFTRQRPAVLWVYGAAGCGKTTFLSWVVRMLSKLEGTDLTAFSRTKTKFWDGYANTDVVIYGDLFTAESSLDVNEAEEFQNIVDTTYYPCNMAQAEDKGWPFTSRYIIVASNHLSDPFSSTGCSQAIDRRRDVLIEMVDPVAEKAKRGESEWPLPRTHYQSDWSHAVFVRRRPIRDPNTQDFAFYNGNAVNSALSPLQIVNELYKAQQRYLDEFRNPPVDAAIGNDNYQAPNIDGLTFSGTLTFKGKAAKNNPKEKSVTDARDAGRAAAATAVGQIVNHLRSTQANAQAIRETLQNRTQSSGRLTPGAGRPQPLPPCTQMTGQAFDVKPMLPRKNMGGVLITGGAGVGKSTFVHNLKKRDIFNFHVYDDPDPQQWHTIFRKIWNYSEGLDTTPVLIICNTFDKSVACKYLPETISYEALRSRLSHFTFGVSLAAAGRLAANRMIRRTDLLDHNKDIIIKAKAMNGFEQVVTPAELADFICKRFYRASPVLQEFTLPVWNDEAPKARIVFPLTADHVIANLSYRDIIDNKLKIHLSFMQKIRVFQLIKEIQRVGKIREACINLNLRKDASFDCDPFTIVFLDMSLVVVPRDFRIFELQSHESIEDALRSVEDETIKIGAVALRLQSLARAFAFLVKIGVLGLTSYVAHTELTKRMPHLEKIEEIVNPPLLNTESKEWDDLLKSNQERRNWADYTPPPSDASSGESYGHRSQRSEHLRPARDGLSQSSRSTPTDASSSDSGRTKRQPTNLRLDAESAYDWSVVKKQKPPPKRKEQEPPMKAEAEFVEKAAGCIYCEIRTLQGKGPCRKHDTSRSVTEGKAASVTSSDYSDHEGATVSVLPMPHVFDVVPRKPRNEDLCNLFDSVAITKPPEHNKDIMVGESVNDAQTMQLLPLFLKSIVYIESWRDPSLRGLMVCKWWGVTSAHAFSSHNVGDSFTIYDCLCRPWIAIVRMINTKRDILLFELDHRAPQYPDLRKFMPSKDKLFDHSGYRGLLLRSAVFDNPTDASQPVVHMHTNVVILQERTTRQLTTSVNVLGQLYSGHTRGLAIRDVMTKRGDCGSLLLVLDPRWTQKLIGFHTAANNDFGLAALLIKEDYDNLDSLMEPQFKSGFREGYDNSRIVAMPHQCVQFLPEPIKFGNLDVVGVLHDGTDPLHRNIPAQTKLWRSPLAITEPGDTDVFQPAILSSRDTRAPEGFKPYDAGFAKFNHPYVTLDQEQLEYAVDEIANYYADKAFNARSTCRVLTWPETINGTSMFRTSNPVSRDSSPGYPWAHFKGLDKKRSFFDFDFERQIWRFADNAHGKFLRHCVDHMEEEIAAGHRIAVVNIATPKDEPRKLKRIFEKPDTRVFYASSIDMVLLQRKYFHAATCAITDLFNEIPIKVGINPSGVDWHILYERLSEVGEDHCFDLDASGWDSTMPPQGMALLHVVYNRIYERCDPLAKRDPKLFAQQQEMRRRIRDHLVHPLIAYYDYVVLMAGGLISGQTTTAVDNSLLNHILSFYVYLDIVKTAANRSLFSFAYFNAHTRFAFYGDDAVVSLSDKVATVITPSKWINGFRTIGVTLTSADKLSDDDVEFKPLVKCSFLKRSFVRSQRPNGTQGLFTGALEIDVFHKMLDWCTAHKSHYFHEDQEGEMYEIEQLKATAASCLCEAANHGPYLFNVFRNHLANRLRTIDILVELPTYREVFSSIWNTDQSVDYQRAKNEAEVDSFFEEDLLEPQSLNMPNGTQPAVVGEKGAPSMENKGGAPTQGGFDAAQNSSAAASKLIVPFSGAVGFPGIEMYQQDILLSTIVWTSTQPAGTVLWENIISPVTQNPIISYFSRPYNCWTGGFIYSMQLVGTGYNGGKVMCCKIPPNVDTSGWTAQDYTYFSPTIYDVKEAGIVAHTGYDQKNVIYHYQNTAVTDVDGNGGKLVLVVLAPLVNANGTACQVNAIIFNRADQASFRLTQLLPISYAEENSADLSLAALLFPETMTDPYLNTPIQNVTVAISAPSLTYGQYGQVNAGGASTGNGTYVPMNTIVGVNSNNAIINQSGVNIQRPCRVTLVGYANTTSAWNSTCTLWSPTSCTFSGANTYFPDGAIADLSGFSPAVWGVQLGSNPSVAFIDLSSIGAYTVKQDAVASILEQTESVVFFNSLLTTTTHNSGTPTLGQTSTSCCLSVEQIALLQAGILKNLLAPGQAVLFEVSQKSTGLPVGYVKFNYPGYFTALPRTSQLIIQYNQYSFRPLQIMPMSTAIPANPAVTLNGQVAQLQMMMA